MSQLPVVGDQLFVPGAGAAHHGQPLLAGGQGLGPVRRHRVGQQMHRRIAERPGYRQGGPQMGTVNRVESTAEQDQRKVGRGITSEHARPRAPPTSGW